jgi:DNA-binding transcriptional ArsR family regulator
MADAVNVHMAVQPADSSDVQDIRRRLATSQARVGIRRLGKVLCDPARLSIFQALTVRRLSVNELARAIERAPAATSQHLRVLRELGLVQGSRRGTTVYYELTVGPGATDLRRVIDLFEPKVPT